MSPVQQVFPAKSPGLCPMRLVKKSMPMSPISAFPDGLTAVPGFPVYSVPMGMGCGVESCIVFFVWSD